MLSWKAINQPCVWFPGLCFLEKMEGEFWVTPYFSAANNACLTFWALAPAYRDHACPRLLKFVPQGLPKIARRFNAGSNFLGRPSISLVWFPGLCFLEKMEGEFW